MTNDLNSDVNASFALPLAQHAAMGLTKESDIQARDAINERYKKLREDIEKAYEREYPTRFEAALKDVIDEAARRSLQIPTPYGTDRFDKNAMNREAQRRVETDHAATLGRLEQDHAREINDLVYSAHARDAQKDRARDAFNQTVDRRSGTERRIRRSRD